jgi:ABC-type multidrug transport system ATPase subunit
MDDVNFILPRGGIVGVIGPNGAGKTTLFRMIVGQDKPDAGTLKVGDGRALLRGPEPTPSRETARCGKRSRTVARTS